MARKLWFKAKEFGWGWTPASIEGWLVVAVFIVLVVAGTGFFAQLRRSGEDPIVVVTLILLWNGVLAGGLITICNARGEPPRWRWGNQD